MGKQVDKYLKLRKKRSEEMGKDISINPDGQTAITEEVSVKEQMQSMKPEKQKPDTQQDVVNTSKANAYKRFFEVCGSIHKEIKANTKGYQYNYCSLRDLLTLIYFKCKEKKLFVFQSLDFSKEQNCNLVSTKVIDLISGQVLREGQVRIPNHPIVERKGYNVNQAIGQSITYFRRYALTSIFNCCPDQRYRRIK